MKYLLILPLAFTLYSCNEDTSNPEMVKPLTAKTEQSNALPDELSELEDCDEKAKKAEENKVEEVVNLGGSNDAGCTIE